MKTNDTVKSPCVSVKLNLTLYFEETPGSFLANLGSASSRTANLFLQTFFQVLFFFGANKLIVDIGNYFESFYEKDNSSGIHY